MKTKIYTWLVASILLLSISSCKEDEPSNPNQVNYALSTTGGTYPNQTTYLFGTNEFPTSSLGTSNAAELSSSGQMYRFESDVYISTFGTPATLRKFTFDEAGIPREVGNFSVLGLKTFGAVEFISATEAYASSNGFGGIPKLVKFNPTNMQITSTVNLTGLEKEGAIEVYYMGMVIRDNYLFMGVNYQDENSNLEDAVFVAVINRTTNTVEKLISDDRSNMMWNGGTSSSFSPNSLVKDANNDIYVTGYASNGKPSGILRIKNGTTVFDADYFFNLNDATGKPCLGLFYFGDDNVFTLRYSDPIAYPFDLDSKWEPLASAEFYKINLATKASLGNIDTSIPKVFGSNTFMTKWDNEKIYFSVSAATSNSIYSYTIDDGAVMKEFDLSAGACNGFTTIN